MTPGHVDNGNFLLAHYKWAWARNFFKPHFLLSPTPVCGTKSMFQLFENQPSLLSVIRHPCVMIWRRKKQFYPTPTSVKCSSCFVLVLVTHLIQSLVLCVCSYSNLVLQWICLQCVLSSDTYKWSITEQYIHFHCHFILHHAHIFR